MPWLMFKTPNHEMDEEHKVFWGLDTGEQSRDMTACKKKKTNICDYANSAVSSLSLQSPSNRSQTETTSTKLNVERATFGFVFLEPTTAPLRHVSYMHLCLSRSETIMSGVLTTCSHFHGNNIINNIACEGRALEGRERLCNHPPPPPEGGLKEDPPLPSAGIRCQHHSPSLK